MEIINRVAQSSLITLDLEELVDYSNIIGYDLANDLENGFLLREKDFRKKLKLFNWEEYRGKDVYLHCSTDAIVPQWAYLLLSTYLTPVANQIVLGSRERALEAVGEKKIDELGLDAYRGAKIILKGCSAVPLSVYLRLQGRLQGFSSSLMYGEACSSVPLWKEKKSK